MSKPPLHPISLRMTFQEKANLEKAADGMSLSAYIRWKLFDPTSPPPQRRGAFPVKDFRALAQLLAMLGQSRLANNMNQLAKAANSGSLPVTPETEAALLTAVREVAHMRSLLIEALGGCDAVDGAVGGRIAARPLPCLPNLLHWRWRAAGAKTDGRFDECCLRAAEPHVPDHP